MRAYLIYYPEEAVKNKAFIELFHEAGKEYGISFSYVSHEDYRKKDLPDFVLNRTRDRNVSNWYEKKGIRVFHSERITEIGNHKMKTLDFLRGRLPQKILDRRWCPKTVYLPKERMLEWQKALSEGDYDALTELEEYRETEKNFVIKSVSGHGGSEVLALNVSERLADGRETEEGWKDFAKKLGVLAGRDCMLQEMIPSRSRDVRVYVLGNQIYQGILRQGQKDFRSNFSLGGRTQIYQFSEEEKEFIDAFLQAFQGETLGLVGLDFIIAEEGGFVFNELEEMVGCRMLYQNTGRNVVKDYVEWLRSRI